MTALQKERIALLRSQGDSYARIADTLGISENTVKSYCRRNNIGVAIKQEQPTPTDVCANCGYPLAHTPGSKHKRFCSDRCRMAWWKAHPEAVNRKAVYRFACPTCGAEFESYGNGRRKYCSRACFGAARRAAKANHPQKRTFSEFSGIISCGRCGAKFRKKINGSGTKYSRMTWACATYTYRGKHECAAKQIPEDILKKKCAEALGLAEYDEAVFRAKVTAITVPDNGVLVFEFNDRTQMTVTWEHRSRRESWTDEMKAAARENALRGDGRNG